MNPSRVFYLTEAFSPGAVRATEVGDVIGLNDIPLASGDWIPTVPIRFRQYEGRKLCDLVGTQRPNIKLFSDRVFAKLRDLGATGWARYEVGLDNAKGEAIPGYAFLLVAGRCGAIDNTRSVPIDRIVAGHSKGHATWWKGMHFAEDSWDGSDVFRPSGTGYVFITERIARALQGLKVTNAKITALEDVERPVLI